MLALWALYKRENKRREAAQAGGALADAPGADLTDRENPNFRYTI
jgi:hypothetical protein